jgi:hypothetical protein
MREHSGSLCQGKAELLTKFLRLKLIVAFGLHRVSQGRVTECSDLDRCFTFSFLAVSSRRFD